MPDSDNAKQQDRARAEGVVWNVLKQTLEQQGAHEAVLYLQYWLQASVGEVAEEGPYTRVRFNMHQRLSTYSARYNANTGDRVSWLFEALMDNPGRVVSEEVCLEAARHVVELPPEAVLEAAQYEEQAGMPVFIARWGHRHLGIPVERDYIQVLVNGKTGKPFALHSKWHAIDENATER